MRLGDGDGSGTGTSRRPARARAIAGVIVVLGLLGALATLTTWQRVVAPHRIWSADASVVFLAPVPKTDNPFSWFPKNAQYVAETAALEVSSDAGRQRLALSGTTYDARLVNVGSQWVPVHDRPTVAVTVSGPDPSDVASVRAAVVDELVRGAERQQATLGTPPQNRISTTTFGLDTPATAMSGRRTRAVAMLFLLTVALWGTFLRLARRSLLPAGRRDEPVEPDRSEQLVAIGGARQDSSG